MPYSRRTFTKLAILLGGAIGGFSLFRYFDPRRKQASGTQGILATFLDTLIPADDQTPAASDLNIHNRLLQAAQTDGRYYSLITRGIQWLEQTAQQRFDDDVDDLEEAQLNDLVLLASQSPRNSIPFRFYQRLREDAFKLYYSDAQVLAQLGITRPPQPLGYPDHDRAPG